jgi:hypothetical protein
VMRLNSIPVKMIRATLREEKLPRDYRAQWEFYKEVPAGKAVKGKRAGRCPAPTSYVIG